MPNAYGYIRCSHIDTLKHGHTMKLQPDKIRDYFAHILQPKHPDLTLGHIYEEKAVSAFRKYLFVRPEGMKLNQVLQRGDHVIFAVVDRAFRRGRDLNNTLFEWDQRGIVAHFLDFQIDTDSPMGRIFLQMRALFAEMEATLTSTRNREQVAWRKARGIKQTPGGAVQYGFDRIKDGQRTKLTVNQEKRGYMGHIVWLRDTKGWGWGTIGRQLATLAKTDPELRRFLGVPVDRYKVRRMYLAEKKLRATHALGINGTAHTPDPRKLDSGTSLAQTLVVPSCAAPASDPLRS